MPGLVIGKAQHRVVHHRQRQVCRHRIAQRVLRLHLQLDLLSGHVALLAGRDLYVQASAPVPIHQSLGQWQQLLIKQRHPRHALCLGQHLTALAPRLQVRHRLLARLDLQRCGIDQLLAQHRRHYDLARLGAVDADPRCPQLPI